MYSTHTHTHAYMQRTRMTFANSNICCIGIITEYNIIANKIAVEYSINGARKHKTNCCS